MATTKTPTVEEAIAQAASARATFEDLDRRIRDGEPVDMRRWNEAKVEAEFAEAQIEGARVVEQRRREQEYREQLAQVAEEAEGAFTEGLATLEASYDSLAEAIATFVTAAIAHNRMVSKFANRVPSNDRRIEGLPFRSGNESFSWNGRGVATVNIAQLVKQVIAGATRAVSHRDAPGHVEWFQNARNQGGDVAERSLRKMAAMETGRNR